MEISKADYDMTIIMIQELRIRIRIRIQDCSENVDPWLVFCDGVGAGAGAWWWACIAHRLPSCWGAGWSS